MMPGMNPRAMKQAMKRMGIKQEDIDAKQVIIRLEDRELVFDSPEVAKIDMMGQKTWQLIGEYREQSIDSTPDINEEDIKTVMEQCNVSEEKAKEAIESANGDLAQAIMSLQED